MDGLSRHLRALCGGAAGDRGIVARYFPRHIRSHHEIVADEVAERCGRCTELLRNAGRVLHVWKVRTGVEARSPLLTLCDRCDRDLRPHAFRHVTHAFR